jgi:phosphoribosylamine--glycine ligase
VAITAIPDLIDFVRKEKIGLTVVGPEAPLAAGVVDAFRAVGLPIFGPTRLAAQLESSKDFAKQFMQRAQDPHGPLPDLLRLRRGPRLRGHRRAPIVIKADGLAAGKGVVVAMTLEEAHAAIDAMLTHNTLGVQYDERGPRVVIEEFMDGEEASFIVMADGRTSCPWPPQDHKRLKDADLGPNTGGMGAYSPAPVVTPKCTPGHARGHHADPGRHERRGPALHRLPVRRPDDRRQGRTPGGRIQLPHGRPGNPADHDAPQVRPGRPGRTRPSPASSTRSKPNGTAALPSAW